MGLEYSTWRGGRPLREADHGLGSPLQASPLRPKWPSLRRRKSEPSLSADCITANGTLGRSSRLNANLAKALSESTSEKKLLPVSFWQTPLKMTAHWVLKAAESLHIKSETPRVQKAEESEVEKPDTGSPAPTSPSTVRPKRSVRFARSALIITDSKSSPVDIRKSSEGVKLASLHSDLPQIAAQSSIFDDLRSTIEHTGDAYSPSPLPKLLSATLQGSPIEKDATNATNRLPVEDKNVRSQISSSFDDTRTAFWNIVLQKSISDADLEKIPGLVTKARASVERAFPNAAALEAEYELAQEQVRIHNKAMQVRAMNYGAARPRARTAANNDTVYYSCNFCEFKTKRESNRTQHMEKKHSYRYNNLLETANESTTNTAVPSAGGPETLVTSEAGYDPDVEAASSALWSPPIKQDSSSFDETRATLWKNIRRNPYSDADGEKISEVMKRVEAGIERVSNTLLNLTGDPTIKTAMSGADHTDLGALGISGAGNDSEAEAASSALWSLPICEWHEDAARSAFRTARKCMEKEDSDPVKAYNPDSVKVEDSHPIKVEDSVSGQVEDPAGSEWKTRTQGLSM